MLDDSKLLFIISQPRAGSTLLQGITSNNPYVATTSEPWLLLPFLGLYEPLLISARYNQEWMMNALRDFVGKLGGDEWFRERLGEFLLNIYARLGAPHTRYILDKTPRYYEIADLIPQFFPNARILVLKRNPHAVANSILRSWNVRSIHRLRLYAEDLLNAPFRIQQFVESYQSKNVFEVQYERMVTDPERTFEAIYNWLDLPFSRDALQYSDNQKFKGLFGDQKGIVEKDRPISNSVESWKALLNVPFWGNWLKGYSAYLGADMLKRYGNYDCISSRMTEEFRYFRFVASSNRKGRIRLVPETKRLARYLSHRIRFGPSNREWGLE
jgi:hypothetical protein